MKNCFSFIFLMSSFISYAQKCDYYYLQNNKVVEMTLTNKKGKETGKNVYTISNVNKTGNTTTSTVNSEMFSDKGKTIAKATNNVSCTNGVLMMDMKMLVPSPQQEQMGAAAANASNVYLEYPADMKEGDALKDGDFSMDFKSGSGINGNVSVNITDRKVLGKESITTPAGTWECFKISSKNKITMKIGIGIPIRADVIEWFAPGFGVVKSDANGAKTEITSIK